MHGGAELEGGKRRKASKKASKKSSKKSSKSALEGGKRKKSSKKASKKSSKKDTKNLVKKILKDAIYNRIDGPRGLSERLGEISESIQ